MRHAVFTMIVSCLFAAWCAGSAPAHAQGANAAGAASSRRPTALIWEHADQWTKSAHLRERLEAAGFVVNDLPLDESPWLMDADLIALGSFICEHPRYAEYMKQYGEALYNYVDKGHTLIQFTQADQFEAAPPFLPTTHTAKRADPDFGSAHIITPGNPLLRGLIPADQNTISIHSYRTIWEAFIDQGGFEVLLAGDDDAQFPALMEGAYGQGRIILSAIALDKTIPDNADADPKLAKKFDAFAAGLFKNLATHVINVANRTTEALTVTPPPRKAQPFVEGSWTIAVLPDTQVYSLRVPGLYLTQTAWIVNNAEALNIKYVLHLGDIVNNNTPGEWRNAHDAMKLLNGVVPYAIVAGNHDYGPSGDASTRDTLMNEFFPFHETEAMSTFGGAMEPGMLDNTFHLFEAGGKKWIIIALEWGPRDSTIDWANKVMSEHPDRLGILITHAYMNNNDLRYDHTDAEHPQHYNPHHYRTPGGVNDGEELWQKLVRKHNFVLALNGHVLGDGTGKLSSITDTGQICHQMLSNYQMRELGGEAYLRLLEFQPDGKTLRVKSYSPLYDKYLLEADQQFELSFEENRQ